MQESKSDPRYLSLLLIQSEMIVLNRACTMIRGVLPRGSEVVKALEVEIVDRLNTIRRNRRELNPGSATEAGNVGK